MQRPEDIDLPRHVAVIMDGNGRWARERGLPRVLGHREGAKAVKRTVTSCREIGVQVLTLFAFSSENWLRPAPEVSALMGLLAEYIRLERSTILDNDIRLTAMGNLDALPKAPRRSLAHLAEESAGNSSMTLCLALSYGGREEISAAARSLARAASRGDVDPDSITPELFERALWSSDLGPIDLMIRTSGELRISNFMLWSLAYAELHFTDVFWPDFSDRHLEAALFDYSSRQRRFGKVD